MTKNRKVTEEIEYTESSVTVEDAIKGRLVGFFEKRASGDSRPCGPYDIAPIYESMLGIDKSELEDEKFLGRLRRSGLGETGENEKANGGGEEKKKGKKGC